MPYFQKKSIKQDLSDCILRSDQSALYRFFADGMDLSARHRLYFTCEDRMYYGWKDESETEKHYMLLDDALDTQHAHRCRYCLDMSCSAPRPFPKRALQKLAWPPRVGLYHLGGYTDQWLFGVSIKSDNLCIQENGYLRLRLERWEKKDGVHPRLTAEAPAETLILDVPQGSCSYRVLERPVRIPDSTACIVITIEGEEYSGGVYFEEPFLIASDGSNILPDFGLTVPKLEDFCWLGQNLSRKEWPEFRVTLNGKKLHEGEVFLRIHRYAPVELEIPDGSLQVGENELSITYVSHYHDTVPIAIREISLLEKPRSLFSILYCPEISTWNDDIAVFLETEEDELTLTCVSEELEVISPLYFKERGLHVALFRPKHFVNHICLTLRCMNAEDTAEIVRMVRRTGDPVLCGSGDMIYIDNSSVSDVQDYLEWYLANRLGNQITIRPAYRWGGHRTLNPEVWERLTALCNQIKLFYVHMTDGRDLPGIGNNPSASMLRGEYFLGQQEHERDGQLFYWGYPFSETTPINELFFDLTQRLYRESPDTTEASFKVGNIAVQEGIMSQLRDVRYMADMKDAYQHAMCSLRIVRGDFPRHTGPSVMFKYFYQAGFSWVGAETMDSSMEPQLAFLRGAAKAFGRDRTGAHLALQWSTFPHDTEERYRRYLLALYVSYIQGVTDINTEEGWWHQEAQYTCFNRFSETCERHREQARRFYRFVSSHSRTGKYHTPVAFLHGRYDGWNGFAGKLVWGMPQMLSGEAEASWQLLKLFYPLSIIGKNGMLVPNYAPAGCSEPKGYYTGTPNGNADILPIEKGDFSDYKLLCFSGYSAAVQEDFDRLLCFVENGGTLIGGWPHFSTTTLRTDIEAGRYEFLNHPLTKRLSDGKPKFMLNRLNGRNVTVCINPPCEGEILQRTDEGTPLVYSINCGKGKIVFINCSAYPGNETILPVYEQAICRFRGVIAAKEPSEIHCGKDVEYAVYLQEDGSRHYYLTPVDWYHEPEFKRQIKLRLGDLLYPIDVSFGTITKIVVTNTVAAWTAEDTAEVISIRGKEITAQGVGLITLEVICNGCASQISLDCSQQPIQVVCV